MRKRTSRSIKYKDIRIRRRGRRWQVDYGMRNGRRIQRSFNSKVLAKGDVDEHLAHESPEQQDVREHAVTLSHLTQHERIDVLEAIDLLKGAASLRDAAAFFIAQHVGSRESRSPDSMRHTFASYHAARYERKDKTALMMGNSIKMLDRHYRRPLHRSDTTEFWNITPDEAVCRSKI